MYQPIDKSILFTVLLFCFISSTNLFSQVSIFNGVEPNYFIMKQDETTLAYTKEVVKKYAPAEDAFRALQRGVSFYITAEKYPEAIKLYKEFRPLFPAMESRFDKIIAILSAQTDKSVILTKLTGLVNSDVDDYSPVISADEKTMYFTSKYRLGGFGEEDIWFSEFDGKTWSVAKNLQDLNTSNSEAPMSISSDGNMLTLFGNYTGSFGGGDIFYSERQKGAWSLPKNMGGFINTSYFECDAYFTSDNNTIFFVSDRPNQLTDYWPKNQYKNGSTWGNTDIYVSEKVNGQWTKPINIGSTINTDFAERNPFLHPDGKTLYFTSEGHAGLGGLDVFKSTRLSETSWTEWTEPVNLGKQINTPKNDWGYAFTTNGEKAFFAASRSESMSESSDIFMVTLPLNMRPTAVITLSGTVKDERGMPLEATIRYEDLSTKKVLGELKTNPNDGTYFMILQPGKNYGYFASKDGYIHDSKNLDLRKLKPNKNTELTQNFVLKQTKAVVASKETIEISNLFFDTSKWDIRSESFPDLDRWIQILKSYPANQEFVVSGHTDNVKGKITNMELSKNRANEVLKYLIMNGIDKQRLSVKGMGETKPRATNKTSEGRQLNRRVEIEFK